MQVIHSNGRGTVVTDMLTAYSATEGEEVPTSGMIEPESPTTIVLRELPRGVMSEPDTRREVLDMVAYAVEEESLKTKYWQLWAEHWERKYNEVTDTK